MINGREIVSAFMVLLLAGCAASSQPPPDMELQSPQQFYLRSLDNPELKNFMKAATGTALSTWPLSKWHLNQLNLVAFYYNPDLDVARAQWNTVKAAEITAGQIPNPSVGVSPTWDETQFYHLFLPFTLNAPVETAGKRDLRVENAEGQSKAIEYTIISTAWTIRNHLINTLIYYYAAEQSVALYRRQEEIQKPIVDLFEQRRASGQSLSLNASQILVTYQQTLLAEKDAERQEAEAKAGFAAALGAPSDAVVAINVDWNDINAVGRENMLADQSREAALKHNARLMSALADYVAAHSALQLELAKRIPDINIGAGYGWSRNGNIYTLGLSITLPIFNDNEGPIAEAEAKRKEAAARFNALQAKIVGDIELEQASYNATFSKLKRADQLLDTEQAKLKHLSAQLDGGDAAKLPLLLAQSEIQTAAIARLETQVQLLKAKAALEYALEQPLFGGEVNSSLTTSSPREKP
jgi:cobalt-zinc-cadmium efflux system outer membrane protein